MFLQLCEHDFYPNYVQRTVASRGATPPVGGFALRTRTGAGTKWIVPGESATGETPYFNILAKALIPGIFLAICPLLHVATWDPCLWTIFKVFKNISGVQAPIHKISFFHIFIKFVSWPRYTYV